MAEDIRNVSTTEIQKDVQEAAGDPLAGFKSGLGVARGIQQVEAQKQANEQKKKTFNIQSLDLVANGLKQAMLAPKSLQKPLLKRVAQKMEILGHAPDPASMDIFANEELRTAALQNINAALGLPDDEKAQNATSFMSLFADPGELFETVSKNAAAGQKVAAARGKEDRASRKELSDFSDDAAKIDTKVAGADRRSRDAVNSIINLTVASRDKAFATGAKDFSIIKAFNQFFDTARVTTGEITAVGGSTGKIDQLRRFIKNFTQGDLLSPLQREDISRTAITLLKAIDKRSQGELRPLANQVRGAEFKNADVFAPHQVSLLETGSSLDPALLASFEQGKKETPRLSSAQRRARKEVLKKMAAQDALDPVAFEAEATKRGLDPDALRREMQEQGIKGTAVAPSKESKEPSR